MTLCLAILNVLSTTSQAVTRTAVENETLSIVAASLTSES